jgi:two-component system, LuxR family, response regulator FixJ
MVYVVDDDDDLRPSLVELIETRGRWKVRAFANGEHFLDEVVDAQPGCVLLDLYLPGVGGLEVLQELRTRAPLQQTIVLTGEGNVAVAVGAMRAGAVDFLEKPVDWMPLERAITFAFRRLHDEDLQHRRAAEAKARVERLSARENEVLAGLIEGLPNKLIAYRLGLSTRTVEVHRASLMEKMELGSLSDVLKCAFAAGMFQESLGSIHRIGTH